MACHNALTCERRIRWHGVAPEAQARVAAPDPLFALQQGDQHLQSGNVKRVESVPLVTWSQKRWHLLLGAILTGWLSLDWGQAAVSAGCGQVRGWSQWNSVWSPVSLLGLYSSLRLPHPLHPAVLWSGVLSFPGTWGSPGGNISGGPHTDSGFASK